AQARLGIAFGGTTADGRITLEPVYCLGLCSVSPSAMIDGRIVARLDDRKLDALIAETDG
ncbi:MAG: NAD(P)H-dependent oxidoreductase subunit E, partial [Xanthobacteraceae bacterium]